MKIKNGFVIRAVGGEYVVVPVGERTKTFHGMINLNETSAFIWKFFTEEHTPEDCVDALCAEYDVERAQAEADVCQFIETLKKNGFLE